MVGYQAGGQIVEVGSEVSGLRVGQKVTTVYNFGSHAALRAVPARNAWPVPKGLDIKLASAIPVPFGTAYDCLFEFGRLKAGVVMMENRSFDHAIGYLSIPESASVIAAPSLSIRRAPPAITCSISFAGKRQPRCASSHAPRTKLREI